MQYFNNNVASFVVNLAKIGEKSVETLEQLMTARHKAYTAAKAMYFEVGLPDWREANRAYVAARDAQRQTNRPTRMARETRKSRILAA